MLKHYPPQEPQQSAVDVLRRLAALLAAAAVLVAGIAANADEINLRREVAIDGPTVTLREVAELKGPKAEALADTAVLLFTEGQADGRVTLEGLRAVLDEAGTNWGLVSLRGYTSCRVHRKLGGLTARGGSGEGVVVAMPLPGASRASAASNLDRAVDVDSAASLRTVVLTRLAELAAAPPQDLRVTFSDRDSALLGRGSLLDRYEIEPTGRNTLGRVPLTIRRYRGEEVAETLHVTADVARRSLAVVATATISRGAAFTRDSIEVKEIWIDQPGVQPVSDPRLVIGQMSRALLRPGTPIVADHLQQPVLIQRGELITVRCIVGGLVIRTVARASEAGGINDLIQVRNEATRETFIATVTGPREAAVNLDAAPVPPGVSPANTVPGADS